MKYIKNTALWALQRKKESVKSISALYTLFLYVKNKSHIRHLENLMHQCNGLLSEMKIEILNSLWHNGFIPKTNNLPENRDVL